MRANFGVHRIQVLDEMHLLDGLRSSDLFPVQALRLPGLQGAQLKRGEASFDRCRSDVLAQLVVDMIHQYQVAVEARQLNRLVILLLYLLFVEVLLLPPALDLRLKVVLWRSAFCGPLLRLKLLLELALHVLFDADLRIKMLLYLEILNKGLRVCADLKGLRLQQAIVFPGFLAVVRTGMRIARNLLCEGSRFLQKVIALWQEWRARLEICGVKCRIVLVVCGLEQFCAALGYFRILLHGRVWLLSSGKGGRQRACVEVLLEPDLVLAELLFAPIYQYVFKLLLLHRPHRARILKQKVLLCDRGDLLDSARVVLLLAPDYVFQGLCEFLLVPKDLHEILAPVRWEKLASKR